MLVYLALRPYPTIYMVIDVIVLLVPGFTLWWIHIDDDLLDTLLVDSIIVAVLEDVGGVHLTGSICSVGLGFWYWHLFDHGDIVFEIWFNLNECFKLLFKPTIPMLGSLNTFYFYIWTLFSHNLSRWGLVLEDIPVWFSWVRDLSLDTRATLCALWALWCFRLLTVKVLKFLC